MHDFLEQLLGSTLSEGVIQAGLNLLVALLILLVGIWLAARLASSRVMYPSPHPASRTSRPAGSPTASRTAGSVSSVRYLSRCSRMMRTQNPVLASQGA